MEDHQKGLAFFSDQNNLQFMENVVVSLHSFL